MIDQLAAVWLGWVIRNPKKVFVFWLLILIVAVAGLPRFRLDASSESLTLERDTDLEFFRQVSQQYDSGDFLVVTFTPNTPLFEAPALKTLGQLHQDLAGIEGITSVNSLVNVPLLYSPKRGLREMAKSPRTLLQEGVDWQMAKAEFLQSPVYRDMILSEDGNTTALQLNLAVDHRYIELVTERDRLREKANQGDLSPNEAAEFEAVKSAFYSHRLAAEKANHARVQAVRDTLANYRDQGQIYVGGVTMITSDMISFIRQDLLVFGGAAVLFMVCVLAVIFKSLRFVILPMVICTSSVAMTLGLVCWLNWNLTVISSNFVALLLIVALALVIHLVVRYREYAAAEPGWDQPTLVLATAKYMFKPCLYTALTTIVAFVSLVISGIRPVIDFGWMMTIGLCLALFWTFTLQPALMVMLKRDQPDIAQVKDDTPISAYCAKIVEKNGSIILVISVILMALSTWGILRLQVENRFVDYFHEDTEIHKGLTLIDQKLGGTTSLDIILTPKAAPVLTQVTAQPAFAEGEDPLGDVESSEAAAAQEQTGSNTADSGEEADPFGEDLGAEAFATDETAPPASLWMTVAGLQFIQRLVDYLEAQPEIGKVQSLATLYEIAKDMNGGVNDFELAVMQNALTPEIEAVLVQPYLDKKTDEVRITLRVHDTYPGLARAELVSRLQKGIAELPGVEAEGVRFSGLLVLYNNMLQSLFTSQIATIGAVFIGIGLMFLVLFRSLLVTLVALIPNLLAAALILGGMGIFGIPLDMMTITIAAITVGMGVDNTIHYIHRFKMEFNQTGDYVLSMHRSHASIGRAMYYTTVIIVFGFGIMVLSQFIPTIYFGLLTGLAMIAALLGALFLLPQLIQVIKPFKRLQAA